MKHNNLNLIQKISDIFKPKGESMPDEISEEIVLVYNVEPDIDTIFTATATNATSATIHTTPTDRDFFLKSLLLTCNKDATATSTNIAITGVIGGITKVLLQVNITTLTAIQGLAVPLTLPNAIKLDRGSIIAVTNSTAVANINTTAIITGYNIL